MQFAARDVTPLIWVFAPYTLQGDLLVSPAYDLPEYRDELAAAFRALNLDWIWQPVTLQNARGVVEEVVRCRSKRPVVVLNFCDGLDMDGYPGLSVVQALEAAGLPFTGAGSHFYHISTSKIRMKLAFLAAGVPTARFAAIDDPDRDIPGLCARLGTPLLVKPALSFASAGLGLSSVVFDDQALAEQVAGLRAGRHELPPCDQPGMIMAERFIAGPEFTVLILGRADSGHPTKIYPPVERVFHSALPEQERFLSYDRYWGYYREESALPPEEPFYRYRLVDDAALRDRLCDLTERAYRACGGTGYARVDIRMDRATGDLYVLEVNANCGISSDQQTSTGQILMLTGTPFHELIRDILSVACDNKC